MFTYWFESITLEKATCNDIESIRIFETKQNCLYCLRNVFEYNSLYIFNTKNTFKSSTAEIQVYFYNQC